MQPLAATVPPRLRSHDDPRILARLEQVACAARLRAMLGGRRAPAPIKAGRAPLPGLPRLAQPPGPVSLTSSSLTSPPAAWLLVGLHAVYDGQEVWTAGRVSDSSENGVSSCLSCCSVLLVDFALRPVPQGGVELSLIVCTGLDLGGSIADGLASCGIHHLIGPLVP